MANTSGWYYSIEGNRALKDKKKGQWNQFYFQEKNIKTKSQRISNNLKQSQTISKNHKQSQTISNNLKKSQKKLKKSQNISKYLKISLMLFFKRCFCETGFFIAYFSGPLKISKNLKKNQNLSDLHEKGEKNNKKQNKTK